MEFGDAINSIFDGNCILFTGAGFSLTAKNIENDPLLTAYNLAEKIYAECGESENDGDLENAVDLYIEKFGEYSLITFLKHEFSVHTISPEQEYFGELKWKRIYTTNYDNIIEIAYNKNRKILTPVTLSDRIIDYKDKSTLCIHLNGYIDNLTIDTLNNEFKLTNVSYLAQNFRDSDWINLFRSDLKTSDAIFFVGFSMKYDLDLKRLVFENEELKERCFFIVSEKEKINNLRNILKFGTPEPIGINAFVERIKSQKESYNPVKTIPSQYFSFKKPTKANLPPRLLDADVYKLFIEGFIDEEILQYSIQLPNDYSYYIYRSKIGVIENKINNGEKNILIHSDLGNGKTLFIKGIEFYLMNKGYKVYEYSKFYASIYRELESICKTSDKKTVIVIDNYTGTWDVLEAFKLYRSDQILIVTERSLVNDVAYDRLENMFGNFYAQDINILDDQEVDTVIELFNKYGFWRYLASAEYSHKKDFIQGKCRSNLRNILLKILESPDIIKRFNNIINDIRQKKGYYEALIFILVSKIFGFRLDVDELVYALDYDTLNNPSFNRNPQIREFVNIDQSELIVKSPILSEVILSKVIDSTIIIDALLKIFKQLNKQRYYRPNKEILKSLLSYTNLQRILNKDDKLYKHNLLRFFENLKNLEFCKENPHFWLQYAIVRLSERNYLLAQNYFETAYSFARKKENFDTYQIDNHYARFMLENELEFGDKNTCIEAFSKAHKILMDPIHKRIVRHYPYRVAQNYYLFYEHFYSQLSSLDQKKFITACKEIYERAEWYLGTVSYFRIRKDVTKVKQQLEQIFAEQHIEVGTNNDQKI